MEPVREEALFASRGSAYNPVHRIEHKLARPYGEWKYLVTGTVGNGKTTEMYHLGNRLSEKRMVIVVDLWRHFESSVGDPGAMDRLESWELLGLLGLAIHRAATERFGHRWTSEPDHLQEALQALRGEGNQGVELDVGALAKGMAVAAGGVTGALLAGPAGAGAAQLATATGLKVIEATGGAVGWRWKIGLPGRKRRSDQDGEVRSVLHAVNRLIMSLQETYGRRLLLIVDGLDRLREPETLRALFVDSVLLSELVCDAVITAPLVLLRRLSQGVRGFEVRDLCNVPVMLRSAPDQPGPGLPFFRALTRLRLQKIGEDALPDAIPEPIVDRLAYYSGGRARDFVRMVRMLADEAWEADAAQATDEMVDIVLRDARQMKEARLSREQIELLEAVMADEMHRLPGGEDALMLLDQQRLMPYPNETTWYYPHPLLTLALLRPPGFSA